MAGEQEVITRFTADVEELDAAITKEEKRINSLEQKGVVIPIAVDDKKLNAMLGTVTQKFATLDAVAKSTGESGQKAGENIGKGMKEAARSLTDVERLAKSDLDLVKALIAEASKTPKGAEALSRSLNSAQEAALKALVSMGALSKEEAQVAADATKLIAAQKQLPAEVQKSVTGFVSLRTQLANSRNELARLIELSGGKFTPEIRKAAVEAGQLQDRFEDVNATINAFNPDKKFQAITGVIQNVAGGFTALQGAIALVGGNSDELAQSLLKVQAALAVTQGLQGLFGGLKDNLKIVKLLFAQSATGAKALAAGEAAAAAGATGQAVATGGLTGVLNTAKVAAQRLYATLLANPFVAVAAALALVVTGIVAYVSSTQKANETTDELIARLDKLNARKKFEIDRQAQENLIQNEARFLDAREAALKLSTKEERDAAIAQAKSNKDRQDAAIEQAALEKQITAEKKKQADLQAKENELRKPRAAGRGAVTFGNQQKEELEKTTAAIEESDQKIAELEAQLNTARGKSINATRDAALNAEQERVDGVKDAAGKIIGISGKETDDRIKDLERLKREVDDILDRQKPKTEAGDIADVNKQFDDLRDRAAGNAELLQKIEEARVGALTQVLSDYAEANFNAEQAITKNAREEQQKRIDDLNDYASALAAQNEANRISAIEQQEQENREKLELVQAYSTAVGELVVLASENSQEATKAAVNLALDAISQIALAAVQKSADAAIASATVTALSQPDSVATFGAAGFVRAAILTALIRAALAAAKSAIQGSYEGEERVGQGERPIWQGKDGYLRRVHKNEGIVDAETNMKYLPYINAMRSGTFEQYIEQSYVIPSINAYMSGETGQRMASSVMLAKYYDRNIVEELKRGRDVQGDTNALLRAMLKNKVQPGRSKRAW